MVASRAAAEPNNKQVAKIHMARRPSSRGWALGSIMMRLKTVRQTADLNSYMQLPERSRVAAEQLKRRNGHSLRSFHRRAYLPVHAIFERLQIVHLRSWQFHVSGQPTCKWMIEKASGTRFKLWGVAKFDPKEVGERMVQQRAPAEKKKGGRDVAFRY